MLSWIAPSSGLDCCSCVEAGSHTASPPPTHVGVEAVGDGWSGGFGWGSGGAGELVGDILE